MKDFQGKDTKEKPFALAHRARATPTMIFFDLDGKQTARYTGPARDKTEFMALGRYVVEGAYARMPFIKCKQAPATAPQRLSHDAMRQCACPLSCAAAAADPP